MFIITRGESEGRDPVIGKRPNERSTAAIERTAKCKRKSAKANAKVYPDTARKTRRPVEKQLERSLFLEP